MKRASTLLFAVLLLCLLNDGLLRAGEGQAQPAPVRIDLDQAIELTLAHDQALKTVIRLVEKSAGDSVGKKWSRE